jgi:hypothetical protein
VTAKNPPERGFCGTPQPSLFRDDEGIRIFSAGCAFDLAQDHKIGHNQGKAGIPKGPRPFGQGILKGKGFPLSKKNSVGILLYFDFGILIVISSPFRFIQATCPPTNLIFDIILAEGHLLADSVLKLCLRV